MNTISVHSNEKTLDLNHCTLNANLRESEYLNDDCKIVYMRFKYSWHNRIINQPNRSSLATDLLDMTNLVRKAFANTERSADPLMSCACRRVVVHVIHESLTFFEPLEAHRKH